MAAKKPEPKHEDLGKFLVLLVQGETVEVLDTDRLPTEKAARAEAVRQVKDDIECGYEYDYLVVQIVGGARQRKPDPKNLVEQF